MLSRLALNSWALKSILQASDDPVSAGSILYAVRGGALFWLHMEVTVHLHHA